MSEPVVKKGRVRSKDLKKVLRTGNKRKYDFKKVLELKGDGSIDSKRKGRPAGVVSSQARTLHLPSEIHDHNLTTAGSEVLVDTDENALIGKDLVCERNSTQLTEEEAYCNLLKEMGAIYSVDDQLLVYVLQDFDSDRVQLKASKFHMVTRRGISFVEDDIHWVYKCSCDAATSALIDCCVDKMEVPFYEFRTRIVECLHIRTLSRMLEPFDVQNEIIPDIVRSDENEESFLDQAESNQPTSFPEVLVKLKQGLFLIHANKGYGLIQQTPEGHKCITCNSNICRCVHLNIFYTLQGEEGNQKSKQNSYQPTCFSTTRIPYTSNLQMQDNYRTPPFERFPLRDIDNAIELHPEADVCDFCNHPLHETFSGLKSNIFTVNQVLDAKVYSKKCSHCEKHFHFDGFSCCVLNMGRNIYCHEILRRFMFYFLTGRTTIYTEYSVLLKTFVDSGFANISDKITYQDFKEAWYAFLNLLDIDYYSSFECPSCGPYPDTIVMDATSVAFRKEMISWKDVFSNVSESPKPYDKTDTARVKERTLFSKTVRLNLMDYLKPGKGLLNDQKEKLMKLVQIENEDRSLISFLEVILKDSVKRGGRYFVSEMWKDLIQVFASPYPFCSFLPPNEDFFAFLNNEFSRKILQNDEHLQRLQTVVPVIFNLLRRMKEQFPFTEFNNCLPYFQQKVFDPFLKDICPSEEANEDDELSFFPSLPQFRRRGSFVADKHGCKLKEDFCNKFSKGHPSLLPGVFTVFCPHGVCYGFQVMKLHESPDVPFTLLRTRFKQAPKLVIYDNACTLQVYCLNRDPTFFLETAFRVDGLHFKNHKACGPSFELKSYPQYALLNSQVVEQSNSRLQRIKGSLSYMTQANFMKHCKFYLWGQNHEVISKL